MKKIIISFICLSLGACVSTTDFGTNVKGETIKKTICYDAGLAPIYYTTASCLEEAKKVCPIKASGTSTGYDFNGYFHEVLYICDNKKEENK